MVIVVDKAVVPIPSSRKGEVFVGCMSLAAVGQHKENSLLIFGKMKLN